MITAEKDILVTTPISKSELAAKEAEECIAASEGYYFRTFRKKPKRLAPGSRIFYVDRGFIRGFGVVSSVATHEMVCETTGHNWGEGFHAIFPYPTWKWIKPIPMKGFQGFRYFAGVEVEIVGGYGDPMPKEEDYG
jgi:hypothetical protein